MLPLHALLLSPPPRRKSTLLHRKAAFFVAEHRESLWTQHRNGSSSSSPCSTSAVDMQERSMGGWRGGGGECWVGSGRSFNSRSLCEGGNEEGSLALIPMSAVWHWYAIWGHGRERELLRFHGLKRTGLMVMMLHLNAVTRTAYST